MRLIHLLSGLEVGGKERVVLDLATRARAEGLDHDLCLFDTPFRDAERDFDPGDVPVAFLPRRAGVDLRFARALARHVRRERAEVLHVHNDTALFYGGLAGLLLGRRRPRIVATFHTRPAHATRAARLATRWASGRIDAVTAVSEDLGRFLTSAGWTGSCGVLWNGVDLARFAPVGPTDGWRVRLGVADGALLVAHIGRFDPVKRQADLIAAREHLASAQPGCHFVLVGVGPTRSALEASVDGAPGVSFVARVHDVAAFLREVDVLVLCSEQEGAPRAMLEAMACGRAIVATDVGGVRSMLTDEHGWSCGELVPPRHPAELARALQALAGAPERRRELGEHAHRRARAFSSEHEWAGYGKLWRGE